MSTPFLAQGTSQAFEDALALGRAIGEPAGVDWGRAAVLRGAGQGTNSSYLLAAVGRQLLHTHRCNEAPHSLIWCACPPAGEHGPTPEALRAYEAFRQPLVS